MEFTVELQLNKCQMVKKNNIRHHKCSCVTSLFFVVSILYQM